MYTPYLSGSNQFNRLLLKSLNGIGRDSNDGGSLTRSSINRVEEYSSIAIGESATFYLSKDNGRVSFSGHTHFDAYEFYSQNEPILLTLSDFFSKSHLFKDDGFPNIKQICCGNNNSIFMITTEGQFYYLNAGGDHFTHFHFDLEKPLIYAAPNFASNPIAIDIDGNVVTFEFSRSKDSNDSRKDNSHPINFSDRMCNKSFNCPHTVHSEFENPVYDVASGTSYDFAIDVKYRLYIRDKRNDQRTFRIIPKNLEFTLPGAPQYTYRENNTNKINKNDNNCNNNNYDNDNNINSTINYSSSSFGYRNNSIHSNNECNNSGNSNSNRIRNNVDYVADIMRKRAGAPDVQQTEYSDHADEEECIKVSSYDDFCLIITRKKHAYVFSDQAHLVCCFHCVPKRLCRVDSRNFRPGRNDDTPRVKHCNFVDGAVGSGHALLLSDDGSIFCFGSNKHGELMQGNIRAAANGERVDTTKLVGEKPVQILCGHESTLVITKRVPLFNSSNQSNLSKKSTTDLTKRTGFHTCMSNLSDLPDLPNLPNNSNLAILANSLKSSSKKFDIVDAKQNNNNNYNFEDYLRNDFEEDEDDADEDEKAFWPFFKHLGYLYFIRNPNRLKGGKFGQKKSNVDEYKELIQKLKQSKAAKKKREENLNRNPNKEIQNGSGDKDIIKNEDEGQQNQNQNQNGMNFHIFKEKFEKVLKNTISADDISSKSNKGDNDEKTVDKVTDKIIEIAYQNYIFYNYTAQLYKQ